MKDPRTWNSVEIDCGSVVVGWAEEGKGGKNGDNCNRITKNYLKKNFYENQPNTTLPKVSRSVKSLVSALPSSSANKLAYFYFMNAGRRHEAPGSEIQDFITQGTEGTMSTSM